MRVLLLSIDNCIKCPFVKSKFTRSTGMTTYKCTKELFQIGQYKPGVKHIEPCDLCPLDEYPVKFETLTEFIKDNV